MSLLDLIAEVEAEQPTLTVYNADHATVEDLRERFADRHLTVVSETTPSGTPSDFVALQDDDGVVVSTVGVSDLQELLAESTVLGIESRSHRPVLDYLHETLFSSWRPTQMLAATREIEDRAWRLRRGTLHVGFQRASVLRDNDDVYTRLADSDLDIDCYLAPNGEPPAIDDVRLHVEDTLEIRQCWFLVYDGAGEDEQKCALLAQEREPRSYYGFWTYDAETVDRIRSYLEATYGSVEHADSGE